MQTLFLLGLIATAFVLAKACDEDDDCPGEQFCCNGVCHLTCVCCVDGCHPIGSVCCEWGGTCQRGQVCCGNAQNNQCCIECCEPGSPTCC